MSRHIKNIFYLIIASIAGVFGGCASIGMPGGGPRDETPPSLVKGSPSPGSLNFSRRTATLDFDEIVIVKDAFNNVSISPTSASTPRVTALGKRVTISFQDSLQPNTTYVVDFGNAIQDNNEGNPLENFSYMFSTGPDIDTLRISGMVLDASNLEPQQNMLVGLHTSDVDTAFTSMRFERVTRTDEYGRFTLRGLKPGKYRVFALSDINNDLKWDNPAENIAFYDYVVEPFSEIAERTDTVYNPLTGEPDSTFTSTVTQFLPDDILLQSFNVNYKPQYLVKAERTDSTRLHLYFNAPADSLPQVRLLDFPNTSKNWLVEHNATNDSLTYWLHNPALINSDTLHLIVNYQRNLARGVWEEACDTLSMASIKSRTKPSKQKKSTSVTPTDSIQPSTWLEIKSSGINSHDVDQPKYIEFSTPPDTIYPGLIRLEVKRDTLWFPVEKPLIRADSLNPRLYKYDSPWNFGTQYRIVADSIAAIDIYGSWNKPQQIPFKTRDSEEYRLVQLNITGINDSIPAFVEILNQSDSPVAKAYVKGGRVEFPYLLKGVYYARLIEDRNGNGVWDTGDYDIRLQPEQVSYLPQSINLKGSMDRYLDWDVNIAPVDTQKPKAIKKNKPSSKNKTKNSSNKETSNDDETEY